MKAIETTGLIDEQHQLIVNDKLPVTNKGEVRVIILISEESDITEDEWLKAGNGNSAFNFLKHPEEDIYKKEDGIPFRN